MNPLHPKKLLLTKWTALQPVARQKHFIVTKVIEPEAADDTIAAMSQNDQSQFRRCAPRPVARTA
jgi:hypothetical protein